MTHSPSADTLALPGTGRPAASAAIGSGALRHRAVEDVQALVTGTLLVARGVVLFGQSGLLTGGTAGLAFLIRYATGMDLAWRFSW